MIHGIIGGVVLPPVSRDTLAKYARVEKKYLHLTFSVIGKPGIGAAQGQDAVWVYQHPLGSDSKPLLVIPTPDIVGVLNKIRKMNRHRFFRFLQRQKGWPGLDLTGSRI